MSKRKQASKPPTPTMRERGWFGAADSLPPSVVHGVIARCERVARDGEVAARAIPDALLAVASGHSEGVAVRLAVRTAAIDVRREDASRIAREREASVTTLGCERGGEGPHWEDIRPALPSKARNALDSLESHYLAMPGVWERLASGSVKVNGALVLSALGVSTEGMSKRAVADKRSAGLLAVCSAWSEASALLGGMRPGESKRERSERAHRWIKRGHSNRVSAHGGGQSGRTATLGHEVRVTRRLAVSAGFTAPTPEGWEGATGPVRSVSYRPTATVKRIRSPRITDGVALGVSWGGSGAVGMPTVRDIPRRLTLPTGESVPNVWHPSLGGGPLGHSDRRLTATGWERNTRDALAVARTEREGWEDSLRAGRVGICPTVTPEESATARGPGPVARLASASSSPPRLISRPAPSAL